MITEYRTKEGALKTLQFPCILRITDAALAQRKHLYCRNNGIMWDAEKPVHEAKTDTMLLREAVDGLMLEVVEPVPAPKQDGHAKPREAVAVRIVDGVELERRDVILVSETGKALAIVSPEGKKEYLAKDRGWSLAA